MGLGEQLLARDYIDSIKEMTSRATTIVLRMDIKNHPDLRKPKQTAKLKRQNGTLSAGTIWQDRS